MHSNLQNWTQNFGTSCWKSPCSIFIVWYSISCIIIIHRGNTARKITCRVITENVNSLLLCLVLITFVPVLCFHFNVGWLGWVDCRWEAATCFVVGNWAFDNFSNVPVTLSSQAEAPLVWWSPIVSRYFLSLDVFTFNSFHPFLGCVLVVLFLKMWNHFMFGFVSGTSPIWFFL